MSGLLKEKLRRPNSLAITRIVCPNCTREYGVGLSVCPRCGHDRTAALQTYAPSVIVAGPDPATGHHTVSVADPSGVRSVASVADDGSMSLNVSQASGIRRPGEGRLAHTLENRFTRDGRRVCVVEGDDAKGIDRKLLVDDELFVLQITVVPQDAEFWRSANESFASTRVTKADAVRWIRQAVLAKSTMAAADGGRVVLAIDVRHGGVFAIRDLVVQYLGVHPSPVQEFRFASVWLVGPTAADCFRSGEGNP